MSAYQRNIMVGVTVLVAGTIFGWMILRFGTKTATLFAVPEVPIQFSAPQVDGLSAGSNIEYQGVTVGRITQLALNPSGSGVSIQGSIAIDRPVPLNVIARIKVTNLLGGTASLVLDLPLDPATHKRVAPQLPSTPYASRQVIEAEYVGLDLFPTEYSDAATHIGQAADEFARASNALRKSGFYDHLDVTLQNINGQVTEVGKILQTFQSVLDKSSQGDVKTTLADFRQFAANLLELEQHLDDATRQLTAQLAQTAAVLTTLQNIGNKINNGQGTAGLLINDPKLYQALVACVHDLDGTLQSAERLFQQWEQEGLHLKL